MPGQFQAVPCTGRDAPCQRVEVGHAHHQPPLGRDDSAQAPEQRQRVGHVLEDLAHADDVIRPGRDEAPVEGIVERSGHHAIGAPALGHHHRAQRRLNAPGVVPGRAECRDRGAGAGTDVENAGPGCDGATGLGLGYRPCGTAQRITRGTRRERLPVAMLRVFVGVPRTRVVGPWVGAGEAARRAFDHPELTRRAASVVACGEDLPAPGHAADGALG